MTPDAVTMDVTIGRLNDGDRSSAICSCELLPELLGHGDTEDEAIEDLVQQFQAITWH